MPSPKPPVFTSSASVGLQPGLLQHQDRERLAGRARIGVADLLALQVGGGLDRRIRLHRPDEFRDRLHVVADDLEVRALLDRDHGRGRVDLAIGEIAAEQGAHRGAAAVRRQDAGDVGALLLEEALRERDRVGHAVGGDAVIADDDLLRLRGERQRARERERDRGEPATHGHLRLPGCFFCRCAGHHAFPRLATVACATPDERAASQLRNR